jgi:hypothetical protein
MDQRDFNKLGLGPDDLVEGYIQAVLSTLAIDELATRLSATSASKSLERGALKVELFQSLNDDPALLAELY